MCVIFESRACISPALLPLVNFRDYQLSPENLSRVNYLVFQISALQIPVNLTLDIFEPAVQIICSSSSKLISMPSSEFKKLFLQK